MGEETMKPKKILQMENAELKRQVADLKEKINAAKLAAKKKK